MESSTHAAVTEFLHAPADFFTARPEDQDPHQHPVDEDDDDIAAFAHAAAEAISDHDQVGQFTVDNESTNDEEMRLHSSHHSDDLEDDVVRVTTSDIVNGGNDLHHHNDDEYSVLVDSPESAVHYGQELRLHNHDFKLGQELKFDESDPETKDSPMEMGDSTETEGQGPTTIQTKAQDDSKVEPVDMTCRICGKGSEDGRQLVRFLPVPHDVSAARAAPGVITFTEDFCMHVFCGKTASILPNVNRPDLEILAKPGLKNKHGIGPEVNAALARTRCAVTVQPGGSDDVSAGATMAFTSNSRDKQFFLVREFEANLAAIRQTHISYGPGEPAPEEAAARATSHPGDFIDAVEWETAAAGAIRGASTTSSAKVSSLPRNGLVDKNFHTKPKGIGTGKDIAKEATVKVGKPVKAKRRSYSNGSSTSFPMESHPGQHFCAQPTLSAQDSRGGGLFDGKVVCPCGGSYMPERSGSRGSQSLRNHLATKRHQKWVDRQSLLY